MKGNIVLFYPSAIDENPPYHWFPFPYLYIGPILEKDGFNIILIDARVEDNWKQVL